MKMIIVNSGWRRLTLPGQFLIAGAIVMVVAALVVGFWVSRRIEQAVVQNSAVSAALFMESFVSPLSQELALGNDLSSPARQALAEIFERSSLGDRIVSYKIWKPGGLVAHASDPKLIGQVYEPSDDLKEAWSGRVAASFEDLNDAEDKAEAELDVPLLEVYSPIREIWTGEIIAVAEFYEHAEQLSMELSDARRKSWLVVGSVFLASGMLLFWIVQAGGRTIQQQKQALHEQLSETEAVSKQNVALRKRSVSASARATAQAERTIRRIGSDLHDGPAQYLSLAALRLDAALGADGGTSADAESLRNSLDRALEEIRAISRGLALPDLDELELPQLVERVVSDHAKQTTSEVDVKLPIVAPPGLNYSQKLCIYRFLQETLSNAARHARNSPIEVTISLGNDTLTVEVSDKGPGFDPASALKVRSDGGQGLLGLQDRAESIGGEILIKSAKGEGTRVILSLSLEEESHDVTIGIG